MRGYKTNWMLILIILLFVYVVSFVSCVKKDEGTPEQAYAFKKAIKKNFKIASVLLEPSGPDDIYEEGVTSIDYGKYLCWINYRFTPQSNISFDEEIGVTLAKGMKNIFDEIKDLNAVKFTIYCSARNKHDETIWIQRLTFTFDREVYNEIDWDDFQEKKFLTKCRGIYRFER